MRLKSLVVLIRGLCSIQPSLLKKGKGEKFTFMKSPRLNENKAQMESVDVFIISVWIWGKNVQNGLGLKTISQNYQQ